MTAAATSPKAVLRLLLRAVDRHITSVAGNQQWRQHVLEQFRAGREAAPAQQARMLLLAREYADLITNIAHHQGLLTTYNIGLDPEARNKQMVEKTAARVGFRLPPDSAGGGGQQQHHLQQPQVQELQQAGSGVDQQQQQQQPVLAVSPSEQQQQQQQMRQAGHGRQGLHTASAASWGPRSGRGMAAGPDQHQQQQQQGRPVEQR